VSQSPAAGVARAAGLLLAGRLVAFPTETVYGLGADAANPDAVARIFAAKGRPADHPLIVHLPGHDALTDWAVDIPELAWELAEHFWPGPLTLILRRAPGVADAVTGGQPTVGLRVPGHPLALDLLREFARRKGGGRCGVAAPSANRFGRISPTRAEHVREELGEAVDCILDGGACPVGIESTILDLSRGRPVLLRPGHLGAEALAMVAGCAIEPAQPAADLPRASGLLESHYAPGTPLQLVEAARLAATLRDLRSQGKRAAVLAHGVSPGLSGMAKRWLQAPPDPQGYAHDLYANLRTLDAAGADLILVEAVPATDHWLAVADRLTRAAAR
jgi:L-threonylcarbamoyladenylate synthase